MRPIQRPNMSSTTSASATKPSVAHAARAPVAKQASAGSTTPGTSNVAIPMTAATNVSPIVNRKGTYTTTTRKNSG